MKKRCLPAALALALAFAHSVRAEGVRAMNQPLVILTEEGREDDEDAAFFSSVRALAGEIGIGVSTHEVPSFRAVRDTLLSEVQQRTKLSLVAWIVRDKGSREMYLFDPWKNQLRTRTVETGSSATANGETLALILRAELFAYLSEPPPAPPPSPPPQAPLPASPPSPRPEPRWALAVSYVAGTFLRDQRAQQGLGLAVEHRWPRLYAGARYAVLPSQAVHAEEVTLSLDRRPFDLHVGCFSPEHQVVRVAAEALLSGDWVSRHTDFAAASLLAQSDDRRFVVGAGLRGRAEVRILRNLTVHLALGIETPLNRHDFQIVRETGSTTVARLSPIRVTGEVGVNLLAF